MVEGVAEELSLQLRKIRTFENICVVQRLR